MQSSEAQSFKSMVRPACPGSSPRCRGSCWTCHLACEPGHAHDASQHAGMGAELSHLPMCCRLDCGVLFLHVCGCVHGGDLLVVSHSRRPLLLECAAGRATAFSARKLGHRVRRLLQPWLTASCQLAHGLPSHATEGLLQLALSCARHDYGLRLRMMQVLQPAGPDRSHERHRLREHPVAAPAVIWFCRQAHAGSSAAAEIATILPARLPPVSLPVLCADMVQARAIASQTSGVLQYFTSNKGPWHADHGQSGGVHGAAVHGGCAGGRPHAHHAGPAAGHLWRWGT